MIKRALRPKRMSNRFVRLTLNSGKIEHEPRRLNPSHLSTKFPLSLPRESAHLRMCTTIPQTCLDCYDDTLPDKSEKRLMLIELLRVHEHPLHRARRLQAHRRPQHVQ